MKILRTQVDGGILVVTVVDGTVIVVDSVEVPVAGTFVVIVSVVTGLDVVVPFTAANGDG